MTDGKPINPIKILDFRADIHQTNYKLSISKD